MSGSSRRRNHPPGTIFGPMQSEDFEEIVFLQNRAIGLKAIVCIHDTRHGPAHGGIRCIPYRTESDALADVMRLAHAMSRKAAIAGIPSGGGKAVIMKHPGLRRRAAYETLGQFIENWGGRFYTGPDVGTTETDLAAVRRFTRYVVEPQTKSGAGHIAGATANGVIASLRATLRHLYGDESPAGRTIAVQGLGAIGDRVAQWLWNEGAELIIAEIDERKLTRWRKRKRVQIVSPRSVIGSHCGILSPNALGGIISRTTKLNCRAIVGAANNPLTDHAVAAHLHRRGILLAPDFLVNAGGLIEGAGRNLGFADETTARIEGIGRTLTTIYRRAAKEKRAPYEVALAIADAKLRPGKSSTRLTMRVG